MSKAKRARFSAAKKPHYAGNAAHNSQNYLQAGMKGFLITAEGYQEKGCARESYQLLNKYADLLYGADEAFKARQNVDNADDDVAAQLDMAVQGEHSKRKSSWTRFKKVGTDVSNCLFIQTKLSNPYELANAIVQAAAAQQLQPRFVMRLVPIEVVCHADIESIVSSGRTLIEQHFGDGKACSFAIAMNKRYNDKLRRELVLEQLANIVKSVNTACTVNLRNPKRSVVVEIIKGLCCMSVVVDYMQNKRHNLQELLKAHNASNAVLKANTPQSESVVTKQENNQTDAAVASAADVEKQQPTL